MACEKPAISTASKRRPASTIEAISSRDSRPLLAAEGGELGKLVDREQLVGQDLTRPDLAENIHIGVDDLSQGRLAELLHPAGGVVVGAGHRGGHGSNL